jgi:hypothetical protein
MQAAAQPLIPRVKAFLLHECNSAMVEELYRMAKDFPSLGIHETLEHAGLKVSGFVKEPGLGPEHWLETHETERRPESAASLSLGIGPARALEMA